MAPGAGTGAFFTGRPHMNELFKKYWPAVLIAIILLALILIFALPLASDLADDLYNETVKTLGASQT